MFNQGNVAAIGVLDSNTSIQNEMGWAGFSAGIIAKDAEQIDLKMDDGNPTLGRVGTPFTCDWSNPIPSTYSGIEAICTRATLGYVLSQ